MLDSHTATGDVRIVTVSTSQKSLSISTIPNNLGLVIKWNRFAELEELFKQTTSF